LKLKNVLLLYNIIQILFEFNLKLILCLQQCDEKFNYIDILYIFIENCYWVEIEFQKDKQEETTYFYIKKVLTLNLKSVIKIR